MKKLIFVFSLVFLVTLVLLLPCKSFAFLFSPFDSSGWVNPNYGDSWKPNELKGTARYYFNILDDGIDVFNVHLKFEGDIFNLSQLSKNNFTIINPGSGWTTNLIGSPTTMKWQLSGDTIGGDTTEINSINGPIIIDVDYTLTSSNAYYYGNSIFAGEGALTWAWDEAQGADISWDQKYGLVGHGSGIYVSGGSTMPTPEPGTFLLLGTGMAGVVFYVRRKKCLLNI